MLNQEDSDLDDLRDIPVFKPILRAIIRSQMKHLVKQLSRHGGEEAMLLTASVSDGSFDYLGSTVTEGFLDTRCDIRDQFLDHCMRGFNEADDTKGEDDKSTDKASPGKSPRNSRRQTGAAKQASKSGVSPVSLIKVDQKTGARTVAAKAATTVSSSKGDRKRPSPTVIADKPPKRSISESVSQALKDISAETEGDMEEETVGSFNLGDHGDPDYNPTEDADSSDTMSLDLGAGTKAGNDRMKEFIEIEQPGPSFDLEDFAEVKVEPAHDDEVPQFEENTDQLDFDIDTEAAGAAAVDGDKITEPVVKKEKKRRGLYTKRKKLEPIVICQYCGHSFRRSSTGLARLRKHELQHKGEFPDLICKYCGKTYTDESGLRHHEKRHMGTEPFKCEICGAGFCGRYHYKRHMDAHAGIKNFECSRCSKRFITAKELRRHQAVEDGTLPFKCDQCPKSYASRLHLNDHILRHRGQRTYVCKMCPKAFFCDKDVKRHMKNLHPTSQIVPVDTNI